MTVGQDFEAGHFGVSSSTLAWPGPRGKVASAGDNAPMESLSLLQMNVLNRQAWTTREERRLEVVIWIERTYDRRQRRPVRLPGKFELTLNQQGRTGRLIPQPASDPIDALAVARTSFACTGWRARSNARALQPTIHFYYRSWTLLP